MDLLLCLLACSRNIFTERLPSLVGPSARRSLCLMQQQTQIGLALDGNPGVRLSREFDRDVSRNTLLRLVRRLPLSEPPAPEIIGIDDRRAALPLAQPVWPLHA